MIIRCFVFVLIFVLSSVQGWTFQENRESFSNQKEQRSIQIIAKIIEASNSKKADLVWPGYQIGSLPTIITFENGHVYAFNLNSSDPAWQQISINGYQVLFAEKDKWGATKTPLQTKFPIENQIAFVFCLDMIKMDPYLPFMVFVHERFHAYQFDHFTEKEAKEENYLDHLNVENLALMQLEEKILADFLKIKGSTNNEIESKTSLLRDFVAVNKTRSQFMNRVSVDMEKDQQIMEGLADYVSIKMFDVFPLLPQFEGRKRLLHTMEQYSRDPDISQRALKWRHYGVGATLGYALDHLKLLNWKKQVEEQRISPLELLEINLNLNDKEITSRLANVKTAYGYEKIKQQVQKTINTYEQNLAQIIQNYNQSSGIPITIEKPADLIINGGGYVKQMLYMADSSTLSLDDTSFSTTTDNLWKLQLKNVPVVFQQKSGHKKFKINKTTNFEIDQKSIKIEEFFRKGQNQSFETISFKDEKCEFESSHSGNLKIMNGELAIIFN